MQSPAWSAGAPLLFIRTLLGVERMGDRLLVDPAFPKQIGWLELQGIPGRWGRADAFGRGLIDLDQIAAAHDREARRA